MKCRGLFGTCLIGFALLGGCAPAVESYALDVESSSPTITEEEGLIRVFDGERELRFAHDKGIVRVSESAPLGVIPLTYAMQIYDATPLDAYLGITGADESEAPALLLEDHYARTDAEPTPLTIDASAAELARATWDIEEGSCSRDLLFAWNLFLEFAFGGAVSIEEVSSVGSSSSYWQFIPADFPALYSACTVSGITSTEVKLFSNGETFIEGALLDSGSLYYAGSNHSEHLVFTAGGVLSGSRVAAMTSTFE